MFYWIDSVRVRVSARKKSEVLAHALTLALFYVGPAGLEPDQPFSKPMMRYSNHSGTLLLHYRSRNQVLGVGTVICHNPFLHGAVKYLS